MVMHIEDQNYGKLTISWDNPILPSYCALKAINSFSAGPYKRRTCTVYGTVYDFADSYLRFGACYVDENTTIFFYLI